MVAVDRDSRMLAITEQRKAESPAHLETLQAEILSIPRGREFDAVVGRFVLMYQPDTLAACSTRMDALGQGQRPITRPSE